MLTPGVLPAPSALREIERISPSRFVSLRRCPLREIWTSARSTIGLPAHPAAYVGTVIHQLIEETGRGLFDDKAPEAIAVRWDELVKEKEGALLASWLERRYVPLSEAVPDFQVRKRRACIYAAKIVRARLQALGGEMQKQTPRTEQWVETPDGKMGGFVDYSYERNGEVILREYKSGSLSARDGNLREEYVTQLKLYASLYALSFGTWPTHLELISLLGETASIVCDSAECALLAQQAVEAPNATNETVVAGHNLGVAAVMRRLAYPSPDTCRYCRYRPFCSVYRGTRAERPEEPWPNDAWGAVAEFRIMKNDTAVLVLADPESNSSTARLRGIEADFHRHPALALFQPGRLACIFDMGGTGHPGAYVQGRATVLYCCDSPDTP